MFTEDPVSALPEYGVSSLEWVLPAVSWERSVSFACVFGQVPWSQKGIFWIALVLLGTNFPHIMKKIPFKSINMCFTNWFSKAEVKLHNCGSLHWVWLFDRLMSLTSIDTQNSQACLRIKFSVHQWAAQMPQACLWIHVNTNGQHRISIPFSAGA